MEAGKMVNQISNRLRRRSKKAQEILGITGAKGNILDYILVESEKRNVYQKEIEKEFGLRPSTATEVLKDLEKRQLIVRIADDKDGRLKRIVFTERAEEIRSLLRKNIEQSEAVLLRGISQKDQEHFMRIAKQMLQNLEQGGMEDE